MPFALPGQTIVGRRGRRVVLASATAAIWTPAQLGSALVAWFDAQDSATLTTSAGNVSSWANKGTGSAATQGTSGNRPALTASALNSLPAVVGSSGKFLSTTISVPSPFTAAAVGYVTNTAVNHPFLGTSTGGVFNGLFFDTAGGLTHQYPNQWSNGTVNSPTVAVSLSNGANSLLSNNGTTNGAHNTGTAGLANVSLLTWGGGGDYMVGPVGEVVITNTALSTTDRQKLEGYLAWQWGLQANLPGGHPYKSARP